MATGNAIDFEYFRYTDDLGNHWAVRADKDWGADGSSGLAAFDAADPAWPHSARYRLRKVVLQDLVSSRTTSRVLGTATATAGVPGATVTTKARGAAGTYTLTSLGFIPERRPKTRAIISKPEPITT